MTRTVATAQTDDTLTVSAPPVRLTFRWDGRRWAHGLDLGGGPVAASVEFEPGRDDPARAVSPAYQQASLQEEPDLARVLLVGQWGPHHGSAVFTVRDEPGGVAVEADVAVRSRAGLLALAATYTVNRASGDLIDADPAAIFWSMDDPPGGRLSFEAVAASWVGLAEAGRRLTRVQAGSEVVPGASTHRLVYRWRWLRPAGAAPVGFHRGRTDEHPERQ